MPASDKFNASGRGAAMLTSPWEHAFPITPSDSAELADIPRALYIGTGGDLHVTMMGGEEVTFTALPAGSLAPIRVVKVFATGTTADDILGGW